MDALYRIYLESCIALSRSVVFYSGLAAEVANRQDIENGIEPSVDRRQWKYFKHLNGDYHTFDPEIKITSLDTYTEIPYTKESLAKHKKTLQKYRDEPRHVAELISKYPDASMLIRGVLNPVPYHVSLSASEGQVLWLDERLIEPQEHDLRYEITKFVGKYIHRGFRASYAEAHDLELQTQIAVLRITLAKHIQSMRNAQQKTSQAHSYHVTNYLASHNRLDRYVPYMTLEQKLFFYININWIERHIGFTETFDWLVGKLLTIRMLPAYEYRLVQKDPDVEKDEYAPTGVFSRFPINLGKANYSYTVDEYPIDSVVRRELPCATDNLDSLDRYIEEAETLSSDSQISSLPTKIIECAVIDPESISVVKELDVFINHWLYLSTTGNYIGIGEVINPINGQTMRLTAKELFTIYWYAMNTVVHGRELDVIPQIGAMKINRHRHITEAEYKTVLPWRHCAYWRSEVGLYHSSEVVLDSTLTLKDEFADYCKEVTWSMNYRNQWCNGEHYSPVREMRQQLWQMSYVNAICTLSDPKYRTFDEFFDLIDLQHKYISTDTWLDLAITVFEAGTGWSSKNSFSIEEIQYQMIDCFKRLSSYSIQFIDDLIGGMTVVSDNINLISGPVEATFATEINLNTPQQDVFQFDKRTRETVDGYVDVNGSDASRAFSMYVQGNVDIAVSVNFDHLGTVDAMFPLTTMSADIKVEIPKEITLDDLIIDQDIDGFHFVSLDPIELSQYYSTDQLVAYVNSQPAIPVTYVVTEPISPSRIQITDLSELTFRS